MNYNPKFAVFKKPTRFRRRVIMSSLRIVNKLFPKVKRVTDAKRNASIEVTLKDATSRGVKNHKECAMAVACKRKFKVDGVIISRSVAYLIKGSHAQRFHLPESVSREVVSFDRGAGFAPGKYELAAVSPANILGSRDERKPRTRKRNPLSPKRFQHITTDVRVSLRDLAY